MIIYDPRLVPAHDLALPGQVLLMNEAPGPDEAASGIPLYGQQGANLFHALKAAGIAWADEHEKFRWPKNDLVSNQSRQSQKKAFLATRAKFITCTNAFPYWPKRRGSTDNFCPPRKEDVSGSENIERIRGEIRTTQSVILICGAYAYLACTGEELHRPAEREHTELTKDELENINTRLKASIKKGWYLGHTRRWSIKRQKSSHSLRDLAKNVGWPLSDQT